MLYQWSASYTVYQHFFNIWSMFCVCCDKISNKISKIIGVLNKLKFIMPDYILLTIYNYLILPHLNYCILAWGYDSKRLYTLQKKALRIIIKRPYLAHTDPMFIKYNVLKVKDILEQNHLKFLFKLAHRSLPNCFHHLVSTTGFDVHIVIKFGLLK